jgi:hypothetical protein
MPLHKSTLPCLHLIYALLIHIRLQWKFVGLLMAIVKWILLNRH